MEDRFKFRAWDKEIKSMVFDAEFLSFFTIGDINIDDKYILLQCTGIEDVKGNLIYEGDILKGVNGSINGIGLSDKWEVKWEGNSWNIRQWSFDSTHYYEIIGNIYQNPELLGVQK